MNEWKEFEKEKPQKEDVYLLDTDDGYTTGEWNQKEGKFNIVFVDDHGCGCCAGRGCYIYRWSEIND